MNAGLMGFGKARRAVATALLESRRTSPQWVVRRSTVLRHRSVADYLDVASDDPAVVHPKGEYEIDELLDQHPIDVIVDFSSEDGLDYYGDAAAGRGITLVSAICDDPDHGVLLAIENLEDKPTSFYTRQDLLVPYFNVGEGDRGPGIDAVSSVA